MIQLSVFENNIYIYIFLFFSNSGREEERIYFISILASLFYNERIFSCENFMDVVVSDRDRVRRVILSDLPRIIPGSIVERRSGGLEGFATRDPLTQLSARGISLVVLLLSHLFFFLDTFLSWLFNVLVHLASSFSSSSSFCCLKSAPLFDR